MANPDGTPIWYELMTTDADAAQAFYADVVGWSVASASTAATEHYRIFTAPDGQAVAGLMTLPPGAPMKPGWFGYVGVADVDATAERVRALGGTIDMGPMDIPGIGRFALIADPQGMRCYIMRGDSPDASKAFAPAVEGHASWQELVTTDHTAAIDFYGKLFGWENRETMSMGPLGDYCFIDLGETRLGAMMSARAEWTPRWTYYFTVASIESAKSRVEAGGGTVTQGPHQVPGGGWILLGADPQGVGFALTGQK